MTGRGIGAVVAALGVSLAMAGSASAATITPNITADQFGGDVTQCSLREAVEAANDDADFDGCVRVGGAPEIIELTDTAAYTLSIAPAGDPNDNMSGDLDFPVGLSAVTIRGTVPTAIDGGGIDRVLHVGAGVMNATVTVESLTIRNGVFDRGGGIQVDPTATLVLFGSTVSGNTADNSAAGGIHTQGTATITNSTLSGNTALRNGGGLGVSAGTVNLNSSTLTLNTANSDGGGAVGSGGGGIEVFGGTVNLRNTIVAGNIDANANVAQRAPDCIQPGGPINSLGNNLIGDTTGCFYVQGPGDLISTSALLGPLAANGGPTLTHALQTGSPAIDTGNASAPGSGGNACPATDQRGVARPQRARCDIGAFELEPVPLALAPAECAGLPATLMGTEGRETISGTGGRDVIAGLGGRDRIRGRGGNDVICGGPGKDRLLGGPGKDRLIGGPGADALVGAKGTDVCKGGPGKDKLRSC